MSSLTLQRLLAPFAEAFANPGTTEVVVNRCGRMMVEAEGEWRTYDCPELTFDYLDSIAILAAFDTGQDVGPDKPLCGAALPGGERVQICRPPATANGIISLTIRRPPTGRPSLTGLANRGLFEAIDTEVVQPKLLAIPGLSGPLAAELAQAVLDRKNIILAGAVGSGKTTLAKALIEAIPLDERLVTIEDTPEWNSIPHANRVALFYSKGGQGASSVRSEDLLEASLRMRPDRVLMQELRDGATFAYIRSVVAGHPGAITTAHSGTAEGVFDALRLMVKQHPAGATMSDSDVQALLRMHVDIVVHCTRKNNVFRVSEVYRRQP